MNLNIDINSDLCYNLLTKLDTPDITYQNFVKNVAKHQFQVKAIIQDILECRDSMETLNELNEKGRSIITLLREEIENLHAYANTSGDEKYIDELSSQRHLLASLLKEFKEANIHSMFAIEKAQREDLLQSGNGEESVVRSRKKKVDSDGLLNMSTGIAKGEEVLIPCIPITPTDLPFQFKSTVSPEAAFAMTINKAQAQAQTLKLGVTEQLLSISRQLAATTQRSQDTLDSLVSSSSTVHGTQAELQNTGSTITQSSKLLKKYGRREFTDKVIMFFAFLFFLAVCLYIVQKRLF